MEKRDTLSQFERNWGKSEVIQKGEVLKMQNSSSQRRGEIINKKERKKENN